MGFHSANQIHMAERKVALDSLSAAKSFLLGHTRRSQPSALKITPSFLLTFLFSFEDWNTHNLLRTVKYRLVLWFPSKEKHLISWMSTPFYYPFPCYLKYVLGMRYTFHQCLCVPWFLTSFSHHNLGVVPCPPPLLAEDHQKYGKVVVGPQA